MKSVDIERLLQWTYIDELPKQGGSLGRSASDFAIFGSLGTLVDRSESGSREPGFLVTEGVPHQDAELIAAMVQKLGSEAVEWAESRESLMGGDLAALIDLDDHRMKHMVIDPRPLIIRHAILRSQPDWGRCRTDWPRPKRIIGRNGKPVVVGLNARRQYQQGSYCPVEYLPNPKDIADERIDYAVWHATLGTLVRQLAGSLVDHRATGPAAPAEPWFTGEPAPRRVLDVAPTWSEPVPVKRRRGRPRNILAEGA